MVNSQLNISYFAGYEDKYGWGNFTYFTFFSEFNRPWSGTAYIEASILIVLFLLSIFGNTFIIVFIIKSKQSRTITNYFVCNLAIADILFVTSAPFVAYIRLSSIWRLGDTMCSLLIYGMFVCAIAMIWTMAVISIDRYMCTNLSFSSGKRMKPRHVLITTIVIWVVSGLFFLPVGLFFQIRNIDTVRDGTVTFCTVVWPKAGIHLSLIFTSALVSIGFTIPLIIIIVNYFRIFKKFWISKRAVANAPGNVSRIGRHFGSRRRKNMRIAKTLALLVIVFLIMWLPLFLTFVLIQLDVSYTYNVIPSYTLVWTLIVAYCNSCVNPFMYGFINSELQKRFTRCCRQSPTDDLLESPTQEHQQRDVSYRSDSVHM